MKRIDGDALIKKAYDEAKGMAEPYDDFGVLVEWLVDKAPPIEPETEEEAYERGYTAGQMAGLRKTGKWIDAVLPNDNGGLPVQVCDQCNTFFPLSYTGGGHNFCPNCGADMRGEGEQDG